MKRLLPLLRFVVNDFGPLLAFLSVKYFWGLKPAIAATVAISFLQLGRKLVRKEPVSAFFMFSVVLTLGFGAIDLYSERSFLYRYESVATNLMTGAFFASSLLGRKPVIQEFYEKRPDAKPVTPELTAFFRFMTLVWVAYFVAKSAAYFWIAGRYSFERALAIRAVVGNGSLYGLMFLSFAGGRKLFLFLRSRGFFMPSRES